MPLLNDRNYKLRKRDFSHYFHTVYPMFIFESGLFILIYNFLKHEQEANYY